MHPFSETRHSVFKTIFNTTMIANANTIVPAAGRDRSNTRPYVKKYHRAQTSMDRHDV